MRTTTSFWIEKTKTFDILKSKFLDNFLHTKQEENRKGCNSTLVCKTNFFTV